MFAGADLDLPGSEEQQTSPSPQLRPAPAVPASWMQHRSDDHGLILHFWTIASSQPDTCSLAVEFGFEDFGASDKPDLGVIYQERVPWKDRSSGLSLDRKVSGHGHELCYTVLLRLDKQRSFHPCNHYKR